MKEIYTHSIENIYQLEEIIGKIYSYYNVLASPVEKTNQMSSELFKKLGQEIEKLQKFEFVIMIRKAVIRMDNQESSENYSNEDT